jgi:hypothetical protein
MPETHVSATKVARGSMSNHVSLRRVVKRPGLLRNRIEMRSPSTIVLVSGEDCPNTLLEPPYESGVVGTSQRFTPVAQPNVDVRFALAGYVLE